MEERRVELVVMGGGPAGLGAALYAARSGTTVAVVEAAPHVGGLCATRRHGGLRYDLGGHIPFVRDDARLDWLRGLLGDDLRWVPRPVGSWSDGRIREGRYLDRRPEGHRGTPVRPHPDPPPHTRPAARLLAELFGAEFADRHMRPYLEKVDGVPLERMPGTRPLRLMRDQAAPEGFWFPRLGIGSLMDAMAAAVVDAGGTVLTGTRVTALHVPGGRVRRVDVAGPGGEVTLHTGGVVVAAPAGVAARLQAPAAPTPPPLRMRAVCLVYLRVTGAPLTDHAWVQVDHPDVPGARIMEVGNWSADMTPGDDGVVALECYCRPEPADPVWSATDAELGRRCVHALVDVLGWLDDPGRASVIEVVRLPVAYPSPEIAQLEAMAVAPDVLAGLGGVVHAPGAAVIEAVEAGEHAAEVLMGR